MKVRAPPASLGVPPMPRMKSVKAFSIDKLSPVAASAAPSVFEANPARRRLFLSLLGLALLVGWHIPAGAFAWGTAARPLEADLWALRRAIFLPILLGARFGKLTEDSGSVAALARFSRGHRGSGRGRDTRDGLLAEGGRARRQLAAAMPAAAKHRSPARLHDAGVALNGRGPRSPRKSRRRPHAAAGGARLRHYPGLGRPVAGAQHHDAGDLRALHHRARLAVAATAEGALAAAGRRLADRRRHSLRDRHRLLADRLGLWPDRPVGHRQRRPTAGPVCAFGRPLGAAWRLRRRTLCRAIQHVVDHRRLARYRRQSARHRHTCPGDLHLRHPRPPRTRSRSAGASARSATAPLAPRRSMPRRRSPAGCSPTCSCALA